MTADELCDLAADERRAAARHYRDARKADRDAAMYQESAALADRNTAWFEQYDEFADDAERSRKAAAAFRRLADIYTTKAPKSREYARNCNARARRYDQLAAMVADVEARTVPAAPPAAPARVALPDPLAVAERQSRADLAVRRAAGCTLHGMTGGAWTSPDA